MKRRNVVGQVVSLLLALCMACCGPVWAGGDTARWDSGARLLAQQTAAGNSEVIWLQGSAIGQVSGQGLQYIHANHLMGAQAVSDGQGSAQWQPHPAPGQSAVGSLLQTPGQYLDENTGQHYNLARYYDPETGRYNRPDPAGKLMSDNLYVYGRNNPVRFIDRMGTCIEAPWDAAVTSFGVGMTYWDYSKGHWWALAADVLGNAYDGFAALIPCLPSGAVAAMAAYRGSTQLVKEAAEQVAGCTACTNAAAKAATEILESERMVLGFNNINGNARALLEFAESVGGRSAGVWGELAEKTFLRGVPFKAEFTEVATNAKQICFSLDGMDIHPALFERFFENGKLIDLDLRSALLRSGEDGYYITYSELAAIEGNESWAQKTRYFYQGIEMTLNEFKGLMVDAFEGVPVPGINAK